MIDWNLSHPLVNLTHLDGRNAQKLTSLRPLFSEFSWMKIRLEVILTYASAMYELITKHTLTRNIKKDITEIYTTFTIHDAESIAVTEKTIKHDLKALEYYAVSQLKTAGLGYINPFMGLGIGSEDINSIAISLTLQKTRDTILLPELANVVSHIMLKMQLPSYSQPMIAFTHGQPASITTMAKELSNYLARLTQEAEMLKKLPFYAKLSGEVGTFQSFDGISQSVDWLTWTDRLIQSYGLIPSHHSTQVVPYESLVRYLESIKRINIICIDFVKNLWLYSLMGYIKNNPIKEEVGSAGMPHKVNPIYFEGAEGGLMMANGVIETLTRELPVRRLQRDFSDSTLRRNIPLVFAYCLLSYQSIIEGLKRSSIDEQKIKEDFLIHPEVFIETIKTYAAARGDDTIYETLKTQTRGKNISQNNLHGIIKNLPVSANNKKQLVRLISNWENKHLNNVIGEALTQAKKVFHL